MSEENLSTNEEGPDASKLDASLQIDSTSLSSDEADFARQMGFGDDEGDERTPSTPTPVAAESAPPTPTPVAAEASVEDDQPPAVEDTDTSPTAESTTTQMDAEDPAEAPGAKPVEASDDSEDPAEAEPEPNTVTLAAPADSDSGDFEEIFPRAAADGIQSTLEARANVLLQTAPMQSSTANSASIAGSQSSDDDNAASEAAQGSLRALRAELAEHDAELQALRASAGGENETAVRVEKENEALQSELDAISLDRDQLIDQLAVTSGKLVQSTSHSEKLEASLRAARGALTPLPEGERALRAEVIGLRGRIEESREEHQALAAELSQCATELAIAKARVEDRQHEVNAYIERAEALDEQMAQNDEKLATTIARHREVLALSTRLQADNNELRSAQAALEETLQARDLEILAREEHLAVIRQGLSTRDGQLVDQNERLEEQKLRCESQDADLQRGEIERDQLRETIAHRESRIATLTETLARIEEAMGHPLLEPDSAAREMPQAEWSRPVLAQDTIRTKHKRHTARPVDRPQATPTATKTSDPEVSQARSEPEPARATSEAASALNIPVCVEPARAEEVEVEILEAVLDETDDQSEICASESVLTRPSPLPPILSDWRDRRFSEVTGGVGPGTVHAFLAERLQNHLGNPGPEYVFLKSLGGSLPDAEVHLVLALRELGVEGIRMDVLDVDPEFADARRQKIELAGLGEVIDVSVGDLEDWLADAPCHAILLSDALYCQRAAQQFLNHIRASLTNGALLLFVDRIASGPLQLSASALIRLEELWDVLPESLANAEGLSIIPHRGDDGGFPQSAHDPAGMLLAELEPIVLVGFGHLADLLVGPTRGPALSIEDDEAMHLLDSVMTIDESRSLTEQLAPRHGVAVFAHRNTSGGTETIGQDWPSEPAEKS